MSELTEEEVERLVSGIGMLSYLKAIAEELKLIRITLKDIQKQLGSQVSKETQN